MLMRSMEMPIFDTTRQWLAADQSRLFHLVVDELHTYRGTPGTEVAYLIRVLLDRLGLTPDSNQLRIIASSASLTGDASGLDYLEAFFGRDRSRFRIIGGNTVSSRSGSRCKLWELMRRPCAIWDRVCAPRQRRRCTRPRRPFMTAVGAPPAAAGTSAEQIIYTSLEHIQAADGLRIACMTEGQGAVPQPRFPSDIGNQLFPALPPPERRSRG